ncbi:MAG: imidazole glycerol phosphate synthase subunit HisH [Cyanobacteria bacterium]|nr:imidazole glycerol phosphate synthase subunit HisH [Cyanobacteriota bacterium]
MIDLVDIGVGNIGSVKRCLERLGICYQTVTPFQPPTGENPLILPGVGSFSGVMHALAHNNFHLHLKKLLNQGTPYLGLCVGLQILFESSEESPGVEGLGILPGKILRYQNPPDCDNPLKIPQIGWNVIHPAPHTQTPEARQEDCPARKLMPWQSGYVYFVNSYYAAPENPKDVLYTANYGLPFCAAVRHQAITAFQFHPEKSGVFGHYLIQSWVLEQALSSNSLDTLDTERALDHDVC